MSLRRQFIVLKDLYQLMAVMVDFFMQVRGILWPDILALAVNFRNMFQDLGYLKLRMIPQFFLNLVLLH